MARWVAYYSILMGIMQAGTWVVLYFTGVVKNYYIEKPFATIFLLIAEFLTAGVIVLGGYGVLAGHKWGIPLNLVALGMMLYCAIFSVGAFGQTSNLPATLWFVILTVATFGAILSLIVPIIRVQPA